MSDLDPPSSLTPSATCACDISADSLPTSTSTASILNPFWEANEGTCFRQPEPAMFTKAAFPYLSPVSLSALRSLASYKPPVNTPYYTMPLSRRSAVLILLFADMKSGGLKVVLTVRSEMLRNFGGQVALPGGKANSVEETPLVTARREAFEEIGLPMINHKFPKPFVVTHLCEMPCSLSQTNLAVRPVVAFLHHGIGVGVEAEEGKRLVGVEEMLIPRVDRKEVQAVFSVPFGGFLKREGETREEENKWYRGSFIKYYGKYWIIHEFVARAAASTVYTAEHPAAKRKLDDKFVTPPLSETLSSPALPSSPLPPTEDVVTRSAEIVLSSNQSHQPSPTPLPPLPQGKHSLLDKESNTYQFRIWGLTAKILVDAARIAYRTDPEFEVLHDYGDEETIWEMEADKKALMKDKQSTNGGVEKGKL